MGYYTEYELSVHNGDKKLIEDFREEYEDASYAILSNGESDNESKWYNHEEDLKSFSKKHPDALFKLCGVGEDGGGCPDIWVKYFKGGKVQVCEAIITFEDYNVQVCEPIRTFEDYNEDLLK